MSSLKKNNLVMKKFFFQNMVLTLINPQLWNQLCIFFPFLSSIYDSLYTYMQTHSSSNNLTPLHTSLVLGLMGDSYSSLLPEYH